MAWQRVPRSYEERHDVALFYWETGSERVNGEYPLRCFGRQMDE